MSDPLLFLLIPIVIFILLFMDYLTNRCPKCKSWHFFRHGLIKLDKPSKRLMREWVKCEVCGHEWEKLRKNEG
mgnify:CR=1 FL=1|jgi:uncharacterized protein (DUF983 family)